MIPSLESFQIITLVIRGPGRTVPTRVYRADMDIVSLIVGLVGGAVVGAIVTAALVRARLAAGTAVLHAQFDALGLEHGAVLADRDRLRQEGARFMTAAAAAESKVEAAHARIEQLERAVSAEQVRAREADEERGRVVANHRALEVTLVERDRTLAEARATILESRQQLSDAFKATGSEVLKEATDVLLKHAKAQFDDHSKLSQQDLENRQKAIDAVLTPLREQLQKQEKLVQDLREKGEGDAKTLAESLKNIAQLQQDASKAATTLSTAMRDNRQRGRWGELALRNIVEQSGLTLHVDFEEQSEATNTDGVRLRPDLIVRLPGKHLVPVDSKVPLNAYLDSVNAELSDAERQRRRSDHAAAVRTHMTALSSKGYHEHLEGDIELTVMFLPIESALVAALEADGELFQDALNKKIIIATPSTLFVLLRTFGMQWQHASLNENARRIGVEAKELLKRFGSFSDHLEKVGKGLQSATAAYNEAIGSWNLRLLPGARATAKLFDTQSPEIEDITSVRDVPRRDISGRSSPGAVLEGN